MGSSSNVTPIVSAAEWVLQHLRKNVGSGKIAQYFADDDTSMTYEELLRDSILVAQGLKAMGVKSKDTVSLVTKSSQEVFPIVLGFIMMDVLIAASFTELNASELKANLGQVVSKLVLTSKDKISTVEEAIADLNPKPIVDDMKEFFKKAKRNGSKTHICEFQPVKIVDPKTHSLACFFSSGTTGRQKAVLVNDYGYLRTIYMGSKYAEKYEGPIMYSTSPSWTTWWLNLFRSLLHCRTRVFLDKTSPEIMANAIQKFKPEAWYGLPTALAGLQHVVEQNPGKWDISSLKIMISVGDKMDAATHEMIMKKLKVNLVQEYGSTEMGCPLVQPLDVPLVPGSLGKPVTPAKLVDTETGQVITEANKPGELRVQCIAMNGYINNPDATRDAFDEEGWFKSGDLMYFNTDGYYFMIERIKELFKHQGFPIAPNDIEAIIKKVPGVAEAAVVGKKMGYDIGEAPAAFVVKAPNSNLTEKDIHDYFENEKVHDLRRLKGGVFFVDKIPKNSNGKIIRGKLREMLPEK